ncbi:diacylglycerol/lipid kinase family protein [Piscibacillus salipiscarius]|uniref:diacylglycerol/lipid kinase family protein n=1 Tax=Piscibacillus salipiscarius TaxID=299480 RepID=UPI0034E22B0C
MILVYVIGLIVTIFKFQPKNIHLTIDGKERELKGIWMLTITNHPYFGGGMKIAPDATINKQTFHVTIVHQISKLKLLLLFITVFFGKHTRLKEVEMLKGSEIMVRSDESIIYHADGYTGKCYECHVRKEQGPRRVVRKN